MARKTEIDAEVAELKEQLSTVPEDAGASGSKATPRKNKNSTSAKARKNTPENPGDDDVELENAISVLKEHGLEFDELKGVWDQITAELKDLPTKKPLVTALGAFLIGFTAGRMSRK